MNEWIKIWVVYCVYSLSLIDFFIFICICGFFCVEFWKEVIDVFRVIKFVIGC